VQYLDDGPMGMFFEEFEVGRKMTTRARTVTEADIVQFASLTGDYNPMHTDAEYMKKHMLGQRVAHGLLTVSFAVGQIYQLGFMERTVLAFRSFEVKFSLPVFIGDTIRAEVTVSELKEARRMGGGWVTSDVKILNQDGKAVVTGILSILIASRPSGE
jgi:3-hydroxybutyryl-CoA dehydratase